MLYNSHNSGDIILSLADKSSVYLGGLVGHVQGSFYLINSYNEGTITRNGAVSGKIGGLIGQLNSGTILNSYNTGDVVSGGKYTSGVVGGKNNSNANLFINNVYNTGNISSDGQYVAGILSYTGYNTSSKTIVLNSYNTGNISGTATDGYVGGIFGETNSSIYPINVYNTGAVLSSNMATGILGDNQLRFLYFNNVFNYGEITSSSRKYGLYYRNSGNTNSIINSYYLEGISGSNISGYTGTSLSREYMASPDFVNLLNQNKRAIDLNTIYDGALADYASYELSDWKYDSTKGYPVLDN